MGNLRKKVIAGNWKMNYGPEKAAETITALAPLIKDSKAEVILATPYISLAAAAKAASGTNIAIAAQNCHWAESGAFTGEISPAMLVEIGISHTLIGHSERRAYFGETDKTVNDRTKSAVSAGLTAIVCVGELLEEREAGISHELCALQTKLALLSVSKKDMENIIIAYEPVWAIGTGKTATADEAEEICAHIRTTLATLYGEDVANQTRILYGGSMNGKNAEELLSKPNIDGGLIGGASLKASDFFDIIKFAN